MPDGRFARRRRPAALLCFSGFVCFIRPASVLHGQISNAQTGFCLRLLVWFRLVCLRLFLGRQRLADRRRRFRLAISAYAAGRRRLLRFVCRHSRRIGLVFQKYLCPLAGFRLFLGNSGMDTQFHLYRLSVEPARFCSRF